MTAGSEREPITLKEMPASLRPRERLAGFGAQALSDSELLAILLRTGTARATALDLALKLLTGPQGLRFLAESSLAELEAQHGIGLAKACQIKAAVELGRRLAASAQARACLSSSQDAAELLLTEMRFLDREHLRVVSLNSKNLVLAVETAAVGSLNSIAIHPREVFRGPIRHGAAAVVLAHNHPSGDPEPSREDAALTARLLEAGRILGIEVLDHLVLGDGRFVSLKQRRLGGL